MKNIFLCLFCCLMFPHWLFARDFKPALVIQGLKHDQSFNEQALVGAERFKKEFGVPYLEAQAMNDAQNLQALRSVSRRGATIVVAVGNTHAPWIARVAKEFPKVRYVLIDATAKGSAPNLRSILFREQEAAFLAGIAATLKSQSGKIGFIGGQEIPPVMAWGCGYIQGARYAKNSVQVIQNMVANTAVGFRDPARGAEIARSQFDRGVDVVFAAANLTTTGVLRQAYDSKKLAIGVDSNQNGLFPGYVLTSLLKRVDGVIYDVWKAEMMHEPWVAGVATFGLKENALDLAIDKHNSVVFDLPLQKRIQQAREKIIAGTIKVVDYRENYACPVK
ncbi:MAG: BMP family ABC transporter substrate-binding protein [Paludibacterium sp.]|uniref:BMP family lipoprotein n=1 Tax=Paludibacterium sp. TaxID=1917523 RepID=UPI0025CBC7BE|nr:BMP family ABC transporter substrate-binding protein [Paludibacterium sp.]MBV8046864.1 BMP family ABC transporter substrate-binding protein [Paludibacterium sp.]MBV8647158.1 BMP family ABC transporter substrate-binding protein [Paludibacterium sp.]